MAKLNRLYTLIPVQGYVTWVIMGFSQVVVLLLLLVGSFAHSDITPRDFGELGLRLGVSERVILSLGGVGSLVS